MVKFGDNGFKMFRAILLIIRPTTSTTHVFPLMFNKNMMMNILVSTWPL
jgi:hypothetical protein